MIRGAIAALLLAAPLVASSQVTRTVRPPAERRVPADSLRGAVRDTSVRDSTSKRELIDWGEPDSVTTALLNKAGYTATRYQGVRVTFDARSRTLYLEGGPAGVGRGTTLLVGDTITYNDSTKLVLARGDTLILRDPSQEGTADIVALGELRYNITARRGSVTNISTAVESGETWFVRGTTAAFVRDTTRGRQTAFYARNATITSCDDSIPDYHFAAKEVKLISKTSWSPGPPFFTSVKFPCSGSRSFFRICDQEDGAEYSHRGSA